jgi:hypothetical protein
MESITMSITITIITVAITMTITITITTTITITRTITITIITTITNTMTDGRRHEGEGGPLPDGGHIRRGGITHHGVCYTALYNCGIIVV